MLFSDNSVNILKQHTSESLTTKSSTEVVRTSGRLSYNLLESVPKGAKVKKVNIVLRGNNSEGNLKYITSNLQAIASDKLVESIDKYSNVYMDVNLEYEADSEIRQLSGKVNITEGPNIMILESKTEVSPINNSDELLEYLLRRINSLESRVKILESGN